MLCFNQQQAIFQKQRALLLPTLHLQGCFDMTEWDATRHLGFGSATVLKKLVRVGRSGLVSIWLPNVQMLSRSGSCIVRARQWFSYQHNGPLQATPSHPIASPSVTLQVLPRLGMKVWPYRKRATMKGIREGLEVIRGGCSLGLPGNRDSTMVGAPR